LSGKRKSHIESRQFGKTNNISVLLRILCRLREFLDTSGFDTLYSLKDL